MKKNLLIIFGFIFIAALTKAKADVRDRPFAGGSRQERLTRERFARFMDHNSGDINTLGNELENAKIKSVCNDDRQRVYRIADRANTIARYLKMEVAPHFPPKSYYLYSMKQREFFNFLVELHSFLINLKDFRYPGLKCNSGEATIRATKFNELRQELFEEWSVLPE